MLKRSKSLRTTTRVVDTRTAERRLCLAISLISSVLIIITGTILVMMLSNVSPLVRLWPEGTSPWEYPVHVKANNTYHGLRNQNQSWGSTHARCIFDTTDYRISSTIDGEFPRHPTYPEDDAEMYDYDWIKESYGIPSDHRILTDSFVDIPEKDREFDHGLLSLNVDYDIASSGSERLSPASYAYSRINQETPSVIQNIPNFRKPVPKEPYKPLSKTQAAVISWNESTAKFERFDLYEAHYILNRRNFFGVKDSLKPLVLFIHGWHGIFNTSDFFRSIVRFHTRVVPEAATLLLDWDLQGASRTVNKAILAAWRVNGTGFLETLNPETQLHCIGFSIGTFACSSICKQFYKLHGRICNRLVAMEPYEILELAPDLSGRVRERNFYRDANYVVALAAGTETVGDDVYRADEYIIFNKLEKSSDICANYNTWSVDVCGRDLLKNNYCERLGANNISVSNNNTVRMEKLCSVMLIPIYFAVALDSTVSVPMIRYNPRVGSSQLVGLLPSVWDSRVMSKDYRFSTFVRNESIWYIGTVDKNGTEINFLNVFVLVVPTISPTVIPGISYISKTRYHDISVYSMFLREKEADSRIMVRTAGPILSAYSWWGTGLGEFKTSPDGPILHLPMTSQTFRKYVCERTDTAFACSETAQISTTPVFRRRLVTSVSISIPPKTCFPYSPPNIDSVVWRRPVLSIQVGKNVSITYSHTRQLLAAVVENHERPMNTTLFTFYDSCKLVTLRDVVFMYDWLDARITMSFLNTGRYTIRWFFLIEVLETPFDVYDEQLTNLISVDSAKQML